MIHGRLLICCRIVLNTCVVVLSMACAKRWVLVLLNSIVLCFCKTRFQLDSSSSHHSCEAVWLLIGSGSSSRHNFVKDAAKFFIKSFLRLSICSLNNTSLFIILERGLRSAMMKGHGGDWKTTTTSRRAWRRRRGRQFDKRRKSAKKNWVPLWRSAVIGSGATNGGTINSKRMETIHTINVWPNTTIKKGSNGSNTLNLWPNTTIKNGKQTMIGNMKKRREIKGTSSTSIMYEFRSGS